MFFKKSKTVLSHSQKKVISDGFSGKFIQPILNITNIYIISDKGKLSRYEKIMLIINFLKLIVAIIALFKGIYFFKDFKGI
jgi:hypothetical protein